ncbi:MAG: hypothetical protein IRZ13_11045 [Acetobacteraceae bacterium]|nr:hypothetical protein [Acetobacteraceae bacterium]
MATRNDAPRFGSRYTAAPRNDGARPDAVRNDRPASEQDRSILLGGFPLPLRRAWGMGLLGLTLWLASVIALFH